MGGSRLIASPNSEHFRVIQRSACPSANLTALARQLRQLVLTPGKAVFCDGHHVFWARAELVLWVGETTEIAMAMISARVMPVGRIGMRSHNHSVWRDLLGAVLQPRNWDAEDEIVEYLHHYRDDLPPEVSIELERHRPVPDVPNLRAPWVPLNALAVRGSPSR